MNILMLGGTVFLGRAATDAALAAGHDVTHFNRGRSAPPDPRVATIHGDREDADALRAIAKAKPWDAVIDTSGYLPQVVRRSVDALRDAGCYGFVSSISAYRSFAEAGIDEDAALAPAPDPLPDRLEMPLYGALKAACEAVVRGAFGDRALIVRPGLIVGPHDPTDRFTWWPVRVARGGRVLAPGRPSRPVQIIDVRDLAEWTVRLLERGVAGPFNATGPREPLPMAALLETCRSVAGSDARFEWRDDEALSRAQVGPWRDMPLWIPESDAAMRGMMGVSIARALAEGLAFRPLEATVRDTLEWARTRPAAHEWKAGLGADREAQLLG